jgi:hypothetical protein
VASLRSRPYAYDPLTDVSIRSAAVALYVLCGMVVALNPVTLVPGLGLVGIGWIFRPARWMLWVLCAAIPRSVMQLLGLPALGVPRVDNDPGLADRFNSTIAIAPPPAFGSTITQPPPPVPTQTPNSVPVPTYRPRPLGPVYLSDGTTMPVPNDAPLPQQPTPPA